MIEYILEFDKKKSSSELPKRQLRLFRAHILYVKFLLFLEFASLNEKNAGRQNNAETLTERLSVRCFIFIENSEKGRIGLHVWLLFPQELEFILPIVPYEFHLACHRISFSVHIVYETGKENTEGKKSFIVLWQWVASHVEWEV